MLSASKQFPVRPTGCRLPCLQTARPPSARRTFGDLEKWRTPVNELIELLEPLLDVCVPAQAVLRLT